MNAHKITWTVWGYDAPLRETMVHLVDETNNRMREGARTLCGASIGSDSSKGYGAVECGRCARKAERLGLDY